MDNNYNNDRVSGMKSILDLMIILVLAMASFVTFGDTPAGKKLIESESSKVIEKTVRERNIVIQSPKQNDQVYGFVEIRGRARTSDNNIFVRVRDGVTEKEVFLKETTTNSVELGGFGVFSIEVDFSKYTEGRRYFIEVFSKDEKSLEEKDKTQVAVIYWKK